MVIHACNCLKGWGHDLRPAVDFFTLEGIICEMFQPLYLQMLGGSTRSSLCPPCVLDGFERSASVIRIRCDQYGHLANRMLTQFN